MRPEAIPAASAKDVPNQLTLARQAGTDVKMTSQVLRTLEAKGMVVRQVDPDDNRAKQLRITPAGVKLARRAVIEVERVDAEVFGAVASDLTSVLQRLVEPSSFEGSPGAR